MESKMRIRTFLTTLTCIAALSSNASADMRPEVGTPLQEAINLAKAHEYEAALARVDAADAVPNKSAEERRNIYEMRGYLRSMMIPNPLRESPVARH
jgi:hypothetical protein